VLFLRLLRPDRYSGLPYVHFVEESVENGHGDATGGECNVAKARVVPLDRTSPVPLWAQLESELRRRLADGEFSRQFPTDRELVETYGVSRHTARDAVDRLCAAGLLERRRGRGTFVREEFEQPAGALYALFRSVEAQGAEQTIVLRQLRECTEADAAAHLDLAPDAPLVLIDRIRLADGVPLALDRLWLPADVGLPLLDADLNHGVLYHELSQRCGVTVVGGWERIRPTIPTPSDCAALRMPPDTAVFTIERLGRTDERPVEWRVSKVRGDCYSFVTTWDPRTGVDRIPSWQAAEAQH
jgi:GntR family transcriptional regulator